MIILKNKKEEAIQYKGRILVELKTKLGKSNDTAIKNLENEEILQLGGLFRKMKYKLNGIFYEATMINEKNKLIEFEVTVGKKT